MYANQHLASACAKYFVDRLYCDFLDLPRYWKWTPNWNTDDAHVNLQPKHELGLCEIWMHGLNDIGYSLNRKYNEHFLIGSFENLASSPIDKSLYCTQRKISPVLIHVQPTYHISPLASVWVVTWMLNTNGLNEMIDSFDLERFSFIFTLNFIQSISK